MRYALVDEGDLAALRRDVGKLLHLQDNTTSTPDTKPPSSTTHESASATANEDDEVREIRGIIGERVARIVYDGGIVARRKEGQSLGDGEREGREVGDGVVLDAVHGRVLERDDGVVETRD